MAIHKREWIWQFDVSPDAVWRVFADTARFNETAGLPKQEIVETPQPDGSVLHEGRARQGPIKLAWREAPVNWVANQWFEHCRYFTKGPIKSLCASFRVVPEGAGSTGIYTAEMESASWLGELALRTATFPMIGRKFTHMAAMARRHLNGESETQFGYTPPKPDARTVARVAQIVVAIEATPYGHGHAARLAERVLYGQEVDLVKIRPLALAQEWQIDRQEAIELCLEATRAGLLNLRWDLLCPRCRVAKAVVGGLDALPTGAHCGTCNIDYEREFSQNVELSFEPAPGNRTIVQGEYCLFGPMSEPHIVVHITVPAGARRHVEARLAPGPYRLRTLEAGPETDIDYAGGAFPVVELTDGDIAPGPDAPDGTIALVNDTPHERTFVIEERAWVADALTADQVTSIQAFRDLFSDQVLRPGDEIAVQRIALMFTDLRGSTALYEEVGDAAAYRLVRDHFGLLTGIVRRHRGAVVKTIGDAVMASFHLPEDALAAALAIQHEVAAFNEGEGEGHIVIKVGLHTGPCIAVTLNDRLDYFGTMVNLAARLQGESVGGDIVLSPAFAEDVGVAERLRDVATSRETANLKGFDAPVPYFRIDGTDAAVRRA
ncbi:MAG: adenylate/guanylate cyclase domain-containing protein [Alphaproteobacteria bacterium]|nr:adenylate/guanylate cyclase domain-containing protein [Alphaproteobacteria bacterium]